ncbi:MAG: ABC transporter ATP-binding protein [Chloroflexi bacterium]|nr:MAG: ABC transporter ATP-binding protein [Chloroflexota bacterium]
MKGAKERAPKRLPLQGWTDRDTVILRALLVGAILFPFFATLVTGGSGGALINTAADAGVYVLLAIGLNIVVGFAGLLDLGYAAFFAIGAYTYGMLASGQLFGSPLHHEIHLPFWLLLFVGMFVAAGFGAILGAPTLRLRGDYLAIVTLGFGEIVPSVFRYLGQGSVLGNWTGGVNGIAGIDPPSLPFGISGPWSGEALRFLPRFDFVDPIAYYVLMVILVIVGVVAATNLHRSRLGRAWMAVREDEVAAAATGVNTVAIKLLAFSIGASFSGLAGTFYGAKLSLVSSENFAFVVSVTILIMVVLGGMGNIPGVILGALMIYYVLFNLLTNLPDLAASFASAIGLGFLNVSHGDWPGLHDEVQRMNFLIFGLILVLVMLFRPQGLLPSRVREQELAKGVSEQAVFDLREEG